MKTILEVLNLSTEYLHKKGIANARRQAEEVLSDALGIKRLQLYLDFERPLVDREMDACRQKIVRRSQGEPAQYIHGQVEFFGCNIKVDRHVLIPRSETELLVEKITLALQKQDLSNKVMWDICCGSGCIGIALKKRFPELSVTLSDISPQALALARENAKINEVEVEFLEGDLLKPFIGRKAHYIVCNPPYIAEAEYPELDREVKDFEPKVALVSGKTGLEVYQRLAAELKEYLYPQAKIWMEIGFRQGNALIKEFSSPYWKQCLFEKDLAGHDRFFFLENE